MTYKIRVVMCPADPDRKPYITNISNSLENMQRTVGGYIESVTFRGVDEGVYAVIRDEEGRLKRYRPNCEIAGVDFVGDVFVARVDGDEFSDVPLGFLPEFLEHYYKRM